MANIQSRKHLAAAPLAISLLAMTIATHVAAPGLCGESEPINLEDWESLFSFHYDYVLAETAGLERHYEPVEVTLSVPGPAPERWRDHIRVVRLESDGRGRVVPHQALDPASALAVKGPGDTPPPPAPVESVNVVFLARCPSRTEVTYRLFWGLPKKAKAGGISLPSATVANGLEVSGETPGLRVSNQWYTIQLDPKSGAIGSAWRPGQDEAESIRFRGDLPIHFGTDVWSPPQSWDHDYDWIAPPNQSRDGGAVATRYRRWGPMQSYRDVISSITYTFYAHVPYVHVSSTLHFTANRSARAVRMGEIVVDHSPKPGSDEKVSDVFSHYAWPDDSGEVCVREVDAHRDAEGSATVEGLARGALAILERDVPWVAGYDVESGRGMASLRKSHFVGNTLGGAIPHSAPCTYVANYGWRFTYWSRPMAYPLGLKGTPADQNMAIAAGTLFAIEEALLIFKPDAALRAVTQAHRRFVEPLRLQYEGTGPW